MSFRDQTKTALKDFIEAHGCKPNEVAKGFKDLFEKKEVTPEKLSIKEVWESCKMLNVTEAVSSDLFPIITSEIVSAKIIDSYNIAATIGDQLTTTVPSKMEEEVISGFGAAQGVDAVPEGGEYQDSTLSEKYVKVKHSKFGRLLSVTEEMVYFDKTGQILTMAAGIGKKAALYRERLILRGIMDLDGDVYRPSGTNTALYSSTNANISTSSPFGDEGLNKAFKLLHNMVDEEGDYILIDPKSMKGLFPYDLYTRALEMIQSTLVPENVSNAKNIFKGSFAALTSPFMTANSSTDWLIGDFASQFRWSEVWPLSTFVLKPGSETSFRRDIASVHKCRFFGNVSCTDTKYVIKCTA